jgi:hypothetical protein
MLRLSKWPAVRRDHWAIGRPSGQTEIGGHEVVGEQLSTALGSRRRAAAIASPSCVCAFSRTRSASNSVWKVLRSTIWGAPLRVAGVRGRKQTTGVTEKSARTPRKTLSDDRFRRKKAQFAPPRRAGEEDSNHSIVPAGTYYQFMFPHVSRHFAPLRAGLNTIAAPRLLFALDSLSPLTLKSGMVLQFSGGSSVQQLEWPTIKSRTLREDSCIYHASRTG